MKPYAAAVSDLLLGHEPRQRVRLAQCLLALAVYIVCAGLQHVEVLIGLIDASRSWALTAFDLIGGIGFYLVIRSGLNLRLNTAPSLALPQSLWAMVGIAWSYAITGPARGAIILIMVLVVVFVMFESKPAKARVVAAVAFAMLATVMVWKAFSDPAHYDPRVESMHLLFSAIVLGAASVLAVRIGKLRSRLQRQRSELTAALDRIGALATLDELTGLPNRRAALDRMRDELAVRGRPEPLMSLGMIDIDHFKAINDGHGHGVGDQVLRRFSECARTAVRQGDLLARWGGEEFLLIMPATAAEEAMATLQRVRRTLRQTSFEDLAPGLVVTFSAGISQCDGGCGPEAAVARADRAMYQAKRDGRDRVVHHAIVAVPQHELIPRAA